MLAKLSKIIVRSGLLFVIAFIAIIATSFVMLKFESNTTQTDYIDPSASIRPEISGWIAWWAEQQGYDLIEKYPGKINSVSPVWYMVDENLNLYDVGNADREQVVQNMKKKGVKIYPTLGSEVNGKGLGSLLRNSKKVDTLITQLVDKLVILNVAGLDVDLEAIEKKDKQSFTLFLTKLKNKLTERDLEMTVAVHAKNPAIVWEGNEGQDLEVIGQLADEVRVMLYDEHYASGQPGAVSSHKWITEVINYTATFVPREKIVAGIPSYGYIWDGINTHGLQFDEFNQKISQKEYAQSRDGASGELIFKGSGFEAWISDSKAMNSKINLLQNLGFNKFIIWHLGGMDENFFDSNDST